MIHNNKDKRDLNNSLKLFIITNHKTFTDTQNNNYKIHKTRILKIHNETRAQVHVQLHKSSESIKVGVALYM